MPNSKDHIDKARHNEQFYLSFDLTRTPFLDWVVNGVFYSALHYLDSYFATKTTHPGDHQERIRLIRSDANLGLPFYKLYRPLKDDSEGGHYDMRVFTPEEIRRHIMPLLNDIKNHLKRYVPPIGSPP